MLVLVVVLVEVDEVELVLVDEEVVDGIVEVLVVEVVDDEVVEVVVDVDVVASVVLVVVVGPGGCGQSSGPGSG